MWPGSRADIDRGRRTACVGNADPQSLPLWLEALDLECAQVERRERATCGLAQRRASVSGPRRLTLRSEIGDAARSLPALSEGHVALAAALKHSRVFRRLRDVAALRQWTTREQLCSLYDACGREGHPKSKVRVKKTRLDAHREPRAIDASPLALRLVVTTYSKTAR